MDLYKKLLLGNKAWVQDCLTASPTYFARTGIGQISPDFLWISCSDSPVSGEEITGAEHGELFVHRNLGNLISAEDPSLEASLRHALEYLKVRHIIVCAHYECHSLKRAILSPHKLPATASAWLAGIIDLYQEHRSELDAIPELTDRLNRLVELNLSAQLRHLASLDVVKHVQLEGKDRLTLHGWIYDPRSGRVKEFA
jgi:carbonic anhydrase